MKIPGKPERDFTQWRTQSTIRLKTRLFWVKKIYIASTQQRVYKTGRVHLYVCSYTCISKDVLGHQDDITIGWGFRKKAIYLFGGSVAQCTLAPEVRSQNTQYEINRAYGLIRLPRRYFFSRRFARRWSNPRLRRERSVSIRKKYPLEPRVGRVVNASDWSYGCSGSRCALTTSGICSWSSWVQFLRVHVLVNDQLVASCQLGLSTLLRPIWITRYESFAWVQCRVREWTPYSGFHTPRFMIPFLWGETKAFFFFYQRGGWRWGVSNFWCYLQVVLVWLMHKHVHELGTEKRFHVVFPRETVD